MGCGLFLFSLPRPSSRRYDEGVATARQKRGWAIVGTVLLAIAYAGYAMSNLDRFRPQNAPVSAKVGFIVCWSAGVACSLSSALLAFLAITSMRRPGVPWWMANSWFDFAFPRYLSDLYTEEGIGTLRKGRYCFIAFQKSGCPELGRPLMHHPRSDCDGHANRPEKNHWITRHLQLRLGCSVHCR